MVTQLEKIPVPLVFEYHGKSYRGEAVPVPGTCQDKICYELDITLNGLNIGTLHRPSGAWKIKGLDDEGLVKTIGDLVLLWYE